MQAWRLCQAAHKATAFTGDGVRLYGGRWNRKGQPAVYAAASQSLAALEILVHVDTDLIPNDFVAFAIDIPDEITVEHVAPGELPPNWRDGYPPLGCQAMGGEWLDQGRSAIFAVPSVIIPTETNFILNPKHADFARLHIHPPTIFTFDPRLWR